MKGLLKQLPSVDEVLKEDRTKQWLETSPRTLVLDAIRAAIDGKRQAIVQATQKNTPPPVISLSDILDQAGALLRELSEPSLQPLINATGVILHTNL